MPRSLLVGDNHVHAHKDRVDRLDHCVQVLDWVFRSAEEHDCDDIWFLGDLFHDRAKIDLRTYLRVFEVFMRHMITDAHNRKVHLLVGNHDMYHKTVWDVNSIKPLSAIPRVFIVDRPQQIEFGSLRVDWMPYTENPVLELQKLKDSNKQIGDILLGHLAVNGATLNSYFGTKADVIVEYDHEMVPVDPIVFSDWGKTFLGHYHASQQLEHNVEYVGSPLELNFGEAFQQKHLIVLDHETLEQRYVVNTFSPKHLIVKPQDIEAETYDYDNSFVRVTMSTKASNQEEIDIKRLLSKFKTLSFDTKQVEPKSKDRDESLVTELNTELKDVPSMFRSYMERAPLAAGLCDKKMLDACMRCMAGDQ